MSRAIQTQRGPGVVVSRGPRVRTPRDYFGTLDPALGVPASFAYADTLAGNAATSQNVGDVTLGINKQAGANAAMMQPFIGGLANYNFDPLNNVLSTINQNLSTPYFTDDLRNRMYQGIQNTTVTNRENQLANARRDAAARGLAGSYGALGGEQGIRSASNAALTEADTALRQAQAAENAGYSLNAANIMGNLALGQTGMGLEALGRGGQLAGTLGGLNTSMVPTGAAATMSNVPIPFDWSGVAAGDVGMSQGQDVLNWARSQPTQPSLTSLIGNILATIYPSNPFSTGLGMGLNWLGGYW